MKTIEMADATESLSEYARRTRHETLVVTRKGRPVAVLTPVGSQTDLENLAVSNDPEFRALIERSRRLYPSGTGLTTAEVRAPHWFSGPELGGKPAQDSRGTR